jgi:cell shape-determining protein MreC
MKKNKTIIFLIAVFLLLIVVFVIMLGGKKTLTSEQVKKEVLQMCKQENYNDAFNYLNEKLDNDPNFSEGKPGREELEKMLDRIYKVK